MKTETDASVAASDSEQGTCNEDEYSSNSGESEPSCDSDLDPSYSIREDPHAKIWRLSVRRKSKSRIGGGLNINVDDNEEKVLQKIIEVGQLEKLKVEQCKVYLRKKGLRLTGTKSALIQRIREHLEVSNGEGDKKYPVSSFELDCKETDASMEASDSEHGTSNEDEFSSNSGKSNPSCDSDLDQSYSILEKTHAKFSRLSVGRKSKSSIGGGLNTNVDENEEKVVQKIIEVGQLEKLKVEQCKVYLRKNGLRLTGNKSTLIQRIKEHVEVSNGKGEKKYPVSSFELDCKGDACTGDVVMFEQNVYDMFNIASHSATGPPYGKRIVTGRIVKESYGAAKQQHTFTIEVLWSKGEKPLHPLHPLLIKGRNLYRLKTLRQRWEDEGKRFKVLMEKHSRGEIARSNREIRKYNKGKRKLLKANSISVNKDSKRYQPRINSITTEKANILSRQQAVLHKDSNNMKNGHPSLLPQLFSSFVDYSKLENQPYLSADPEKAEAIKRQQKLPLQLQEELGALQNDCQTKVHQNLVKPSDVSVDSINRSPLRSINHYHPISPPQKQSSMKQQLCPYYPEGRCYYGDNCKFLHGQKDKYDHGRKDGSHLGLVRQPYRSINHHHPTSPRQKQISTKQQLCPYEKKGRCYFGDSCKFLHGRRDEYNRGPDQVVEQFGWRGN